MTSVNVTTQTNTVTVQQGDATTVTIATQGPQGPAGAGLSDVVDDTSPQLGGDLASNSFDINFADNDNAVFGDGSDLKIFHNGTRSEIVNANVNNFTIRQGFGGNGFMFIHADKLQLRSHSTNEQYISCTNNGSVELYHDNVKKAETTSDGLKVDSSLFINSGSGTLQALRFHNDITGTGINDGAAITYSTNSHALFLSCPESNGNMVFQTGGSQMNNRTLLISNSGVVTLQRNQEPMLVATPNAGVELYHNNVKKVETTSSGITVTGSVTTQDMNMSNLNGTANEVDNTKGSWSIQEGADDLFLINRVSGKKYKFNLTEVS